MGKNLHTSKPIKEVQIDPHQEEAVLLGNFTSRKHPRGFSVDFDPDPEPLDSVVTRITSIGSEQHYELIMQIANHGTKPIAAKVWAL